MIDRNFVVQDQHLKHVIRGTVGSADGDRPRFDWAGTIAGKAPPSRVRVSQGLEARPVDVAHLADLIGSDLWS